MICGIDIKIIQWDLSIDCWCNIKQEDVIEKWIDRKIWKNIVEDIWKIETCNVSNKMLHIVIIDCILKWNARWNEWVWKESDQAKRFEIYSICECCKKLLQGKCDW